MNNFQIVLSVIVPLFSLLSFFAYHKYNLFDKLFKTILYTILSIGYIPVLWNLIILTLTTDLQVKLGVDSAESINILESYYIPVVVLFIICGLSIAYITILLSVLRGQKKQ